MQGALRELEEEAGLVMDPRNSSTHLFCLWESVFPPLIALGEPRSHHIVLYFHSKSSETWKQLQAKIKVSCIHIYFIYVFFSAYKRQRLNSSYGSKYSPFLCM
jgi:8-oxo-dGTP pyrophosphatase MutT (NUDIX family)